ncbi:4-hydroxybenzoate octaprenyltransferase [Rhodobium gokarnense]|uniref:4-hydroxybenzoate octaprenyltransferase n=1 Tax=Rhodobium gokarnense TaxID=364296 RepID=A0ABT3HCT0_9HYPH|nr:4-hydroxybenzoate octaprenyltransferase [Rhodobium gokarnense]MCW2308182.1 4-hydroxybenzoate polyprenyltransferase [Rhodobium gokarnense]
MSELTGMVTDAVSGNWVDRRAPAWLKPYGRLARWDRPIGWWLLMWPCWWSAALAAGHAGTPFPDPWHLFLFMVGAIAMRGAGCTYNDLVDENIDSRVERTRTRPIPSGQVTRNQARIFMVLQSLVGLAVLVQFNRFSIGLGIASLAIVAAYPFMKRVTDWPQSVLGLSFSWGALMGWAAVFGHLDWAPVALYFAGFFWTIGYDTIYAHQDKEDDALVGVRSTALLFADRTLQWVSGLYLAAVFCVALALWLAGAGPFAYLGLLAVMVHLGWQLARLDINDSARCLALFRSNRDTGWLLFGGLVLDSLARNL